MSGYGRKIILFSTLPALFVVLVLIYRNHVLHAKGMTYLAAMFGTPLPASFKVVKAKVYIPFFGPTDSDGGADYTIQCDKKDFLLLLSHKPYTRDYLYDYGKHLTDVFDPQTVPSTVVIAVFPIEETKMRAYFRITNLDVDKVMAKVELDYHPSHWLHLQRKMIKPKQTPEPIQTPEPKQGDSMLQQLQIIR